MESINISAFSMLNGSPDSPALVLGLAELIGDYAVPTAAAWLIFAWVRMPPNLRPRLILATLTALTAVAMVQVIGPFWYHPRPFAVGLGHQLIPHLADSSFPSDHGTLFFTLAASFLLAPITRWIGFGFAATGLAVAWSRIFVGVHYPLDMIGAAGLGAITALGFTQLSDRWLSQGTAMASRLYEAILRLLHLPRAIFPRET